ncbi:hypothetical protein HanXRQr2_Chr13g0616051 [Helianthus annuus]|uniref:Uncharacterized protein n=1 Tax=Helianthus annuus TaxID=4232 RepID=A0A9K3HCZ1_HELAN|nr:hypothetical protein HanXRQr2_Chr13g0616051 [Helianthus annuus]
MVDDFLLFFLLVYICKKMIRQLDKLIIDNFFILPLWYSYFNKESFDIKGEDQIQF